MKWLKKFEIIEPHFMELQKDSETPEYMMVLEYFNGANDTKTQGFGNEEPTQVKEFFEYEINLEKLRKNRKWQHFLMASVYKFYQMGAGNLLRKYLEAHPGKLTFYALAATWEFETNGNIISARVRRAMISMKEEVEIEPNNMDDSMMMMMTDEEYRESVEELGSKELSYLFTEFLERSMHKSQQETLIYGIRISRDLYKWEFNEFKNRKMEAILNAISKFASMQLNEMTIYKLGTLDRGFGKDSPASRKKRFPIIIEKQDAKIPNSNFEECLLQ
ncbi:hypothetical protein Glove_86g169 [Diversispora epigaea]|uniref:Uncharacterized protein n=1 Tax=Diversispora epigaea TaxID=1348612 RepID=A0A397JFK8_9GLOM|nr:hypothetical protein Glove_86g169 [Diversispora epigaea]